MHCTLNTAHTTTIHTCCVQQLIAAVHILMQTILAQARPTMPCICLVGASLSEPHTSDTALHFCLSFCLSVCLSYGTYVLPPGSRGAMHVFKMASHVTRMQYSNLWRMKSQ